MSSAEKFSNIFNEVIMTQGFERFHDAARACGILGGQTGTTTFPCGGSCGLHRQSLDTEPRVLGRNTRFILSRKLRVGGELQRVFRARDLVSYRYVEVVFARWTLCCPELSLVLSLSFLASRVFFMDSSPNGLSQFCFPLSEQPHDHSGSVSRRNSGESVGHRPGEVGTVEGMCGRGSLHTPVSDKVALH